METDIIRKFIDRMNEIFPEYVVYLNKMTLGDKLPMSYTNNTLTSSLEDLVTSCNQVSLFRLGEKKVEKSTYTSGITLDIVRDSNINAKIGYLNVSDADFNRLDHFRLDKVKDIDISLNEDILTIAITVPSRSISFWWKLPEGGIYGYQYSK